MIWLISSIFLSASLMLLFRWFSQVGIHTQTAIVVNYLVCMVTGTLLAGRHHIFNSDLPMKPWFWPCLLLGVLFIVVFSAMGRSAKLAGSALTAMASKMGLLIPVLTAVIFLGESWNWTILPGLIQFSQILAYRAARDIRILFLIGYTPGMITAPIARYFGRILIFVSLLSLIACGAAHIFMYQFLKEKGFQTSQWPSWEAFLLMITVAVILYIYTLISLKKSVRNICS